MNEIRYYGFVDESGKMQIHGRHSFVEDIRLFTGKAIDIIVRVQGRRTNVQNAYYWSGIIPIVQRGMKDMGVVMSKEQTHDLLKYKFLLIEFITGDGEVIKSIGSTRKLSKEEFGEYIDNISRWAQEYLNITIPQPNEQTIIQI